MSYNIDFYMKKHLFERIQKVSNTIWSHFSIWDLPDTLKAHLGFFGQHPGFGSFFFQTSKIVLGVDQVIIWVSRTEKGCPKWLSNTLSAHAFEKRILTRKSFDIFGLFFGKDPRGGIINYGELLTTSRYLTISYNVLTSLIVKDLETLEFS